MCIAHHLMTMGHTFRKRFPEHFNTDLVTFVDLIPKVRNVGISTFLSQMRSQRKQLLDMLGEAQGLESLFYRFDSQRCYSLSASVFLSQMM